MNDCADTADIPSFEEGAPRRFNRWNATFRNRRGGGGRTLVARVVWPPRPRRFL